MDPLKTRLMFECEKELTDHLTMGERYRYYLSRMQYVPYKSGKENFSAADCSGTVCLALLLATGMSIRVTADDLYRKYFTVRNPGKDDITAAFFITTYDRLLGTRLYKAGTCAHVAGVAGTDVVLNCVEPRAVLRSLSDMRSAYRAMDYHCEVRGLNIDALREASDKGDDLFGGDTEFMQYRELVTERKVPCP